MSDGIEIHFDEKRGLLKLACEPDAFAPYREIARTQLADFPDIAIDKVIEINVVDVQRSSRNAMHPRSRILGWIIGGLLVLIIALALVGTVVVVRWLTT